MKINTKWLAILFFISIAVNIYFVGTVLGHKQYIKLKKPHYEPRFSMRQLTSGLPKDVRRQIGTAMRSQQETLLLYSNRQKVLRKQIIELLSAEIVDVEALRKAFEEQRTITGEIQTPAHEALLAVLPTVDLKSRRAMIKDMREKMQKNKRRPQQFQKNQSKNR